ncbi:MAG: nucleotide sugar dehydrogenase [Gammaproteobacteria bacterium]|nr:nucleotide sugar dehydrogenase [Gammaproteobacteria bacterium]
MNRKISVVGLGYVGLPVAVAFAKKSPVIAFDINAKRIEALKNSIDVTGEISTDEFEKLNILFTVDASELQKADFYIVAVPTPIDSSNKPDLSALLSASQLIGSQLKSGDIVVYESTVYPGATEEDCVPVLEKNSGLICGRDFYLGYSPERINPADKEHTFVNTKKIVSGQTPEILNIISEVYGSVVEAGVYRASSIKVAEAAKVIENAQRDLNIAFVNELSKIFRLMGIDTNEVLDAAATKWNFTQYAPGFVGGHCIGVDPFYLTYKAQRLGYHPEVLLAGRRINDGMAKYVADQTIKIMIHAGKLIKGMSVLVLGLTFKQNCPDIRNSKVFDLIRELELFEVDLTLHDALASPEAVLKSEQYMLTNWDDVNQKKYDVIVLAVPHEFYKNTELPQHDILIDVKGVCEKSAFRL